MQDLVAQGIEKLESQLQQCQQKLQDIQTVRADLAKTDQQLQVEKDRIETERNSILQQHNMQSKFKTKVCSAARHAHTFASISASLPVPYFSLLQRIQ